MSTRSVCPQTRQPAPIHVRAAVFAFLQASCCRPVFWVCSSRPARLGRYALQICPLVPIIGVVGGPPLRCCGRRRTNRRMDFGQADPNAYRAATDRLPQDALACASWCRGLEHHSYHDENSCDAVRGFFHAPSSLGSIARVPRDDIAPCARRLHLGRFSASAVVAPASNRAGRSTARRLGDHMAHTHTHTHGRCLTVMSLFMT
jgi:hypothetical protein